jgi:transcriptional regulator with XRE-family HTH domain
MELSEYIKAQGLTPSGFAEQIGVPASTITRVMAGHRKPGFELLEKIHAATNGVVEPNDFLKQPTPSDPSSKFPGSAEVGLPTKGGREA